MSRLAHCLSLIVPVLLLGGCSGMPALWGDSTPRDVELAQMAGTSDCGIASDGPSLLVFSDEKALREWARRVDLPQLGDDLIPERAYAVVAADADAGGIAVSRHAVVVRDTLEIRASRLSGTEQTRGASPCAVVMLPEGLTGRSRVEMRDPRGMLLAVWPPPVQ